MVFEGLKKSVLRCLTKSGSEQHLGAWYGWSDPINFNSDLGNTDTCYWKNSLKSWTGTQWFCLCFARRPEYLDTNQGGEVPLGAEHSSTACSAVGKWLSVCVCVCVCVGMSIGYCHAASCDTDMIISWCVTRFLNLIVNLYLHYNSVVSTLEAVSFLTQSSCTY